MTVPLQHAEPEKQHAGRLIPDAKLLAAHAEQTLSDLDELLASLKPTIATINRLAETIEKFLPKANP